MSRRDDRVSLLDMLGHAREAVELLGGTSREALGRDRVMRLALTRLVEIVGEAANRVSRVTQQETPHIPWAQIIGMRNRLVHGYDVIDEDLLRNTVTNDLPPLIAALQQILDDAPMKTKPLGRTGLNLSIVGLGAAFIGIPDPNRAAVEYAGRPGQMEDDLGVRTVHAAIEAGCTLIDTAPHYGLTRSERIIGRALLERPDLAARCTVTTKAGHIGEDRDYARDAILRSVEASLERLGLERFDVVYIHDAMDVPMELVMGKTGALGALRELQAQGVVRFVGTAANDPETNAAYLETGEFDAAVVPEAWSLLNQLAAERILPAAEKHNVGLVVATPVERGLLATGPAPGTNYLARNFSQECLDHVAKIQRLCQSHNIPMVAAALQWCTRHPQVAATIPGARTPEEARENARAGALDIPESFWDHLAPLVCHWPKGVHR